MAITERDQETSTRERILRLAIEAIDAGGEASIRVKQIADDAGVSVTSLYHFYGSREGLVEAALVERFEDGYRRGREEFRLLAETSRNRKEFAKGLDELLRATFGSHNTSARRRRINVAGAAFARPSLLIRINETQRLWMQELVETLTVARSRDLIDDVDIVSIAAWHIITSNGVVSIEGDSTGAHFGRWLDFYIDTMLQRLGLR